MMRCFGCMFGHQAEHGGIEISRKEQTEVCELVAKTLYEFCAPDKGTHPELQVIFVHGLEYEDSSQAYLEETWKAADGSILWPKWLTTEFNNMRILSVSYDSSLNEGLKIGRLDLYQIGENLIQVLADENVGAGVQRRCPLFMVGKDLGCWIIQAICVHAKRQDRFLRNLKGILFYCPPGVGVLGLPPSFRGKLATNLRLFDEDVSRLNTEFSKLKEDEKWMLRTMNAGHLAPKGEPIREYPEASARLYGGDYYTADEDIHSICRPANNTSISFRYLHRLIFDCLNTAVHKCQLQSAHLVGLEDRIKELECKMIRLSVLGIVGMGGIGKTTLAKQLFNSVSWQFRYTCFVEVEKCPPMSSLDDYVKTHFYFRGQAMMKPIEWDYLKGESTLIVMDGVDSETQLDSLPSLSEDDIKSAYQGIRIIITTRNQDVLNIYRHVKPICYEVGILNEEDAKSLFYAHAFGLDINGPHPKPVAVDLTSVAEEVIQKCHGLPLTLEVLGRYLCKHTKNLTAWKETIQKLKDAESINGDSHDRLWARLEISYDALAEEEQDMFIDVATFFVNQPLEEAFAAWSTEHGKQETRWSNLVSRFLVKSEKCFDHHNGVFYERIWMHEQLQALGKMLSSKFERRLSSTVRNKVCRDEQIIPCRYRIADQRFNVHESHFSRLKYLDLIRVQSLKFFKALRILKLRKIEGLNQFPEDFCTLSYLRVLELEHVNLKELPESLGGLLSLMTIVVRWCRDLVSLPNSIGNLKSLRHMILGSMIPRNNSIRLQELPANIGQLIALEKLVINAQALESLPDNFCQLQSLQELALRSDTMSALTQYFGRLTTMRKLDLDVQWLETLSDDFHLLKTLEEVKICSRVLGELPEHFGQLGALRKLLLKTPNLRRLPESIGELSSLEEFYLDDEESSCSLPESVGQLKSLKRLTFSARSLNKLPKNFEVLSSVQQVEILCGAEPNKYGQFPASMAVLSGPLVIQGCSSEARLPDGVENLTALQDLTLFGLYDTTLPSTLGDLVCLKKLTINACRVLKHLPEELGNLSALQELSILECGELETLPKEMDNSDKLPSLKKVNLGGVYKLQTWPQRSVNRSRRAMARTTAATTMAMVRTTAATTMAMVRTTAATTRAMATKMVTPNASWMDDYEIEMFEVGTSMGDYESEMSSLDNDGDGN